MVHVRHERYRRFAVGGRVSVAGYDVAEIVLARRDSDGLQRLKYEGGGRAFVKRNGGAAAELAQYLQSAFFKAVRGHGVQIAPIGISFAVVVVIIRNPKPKAAGVSMFALGDGHSHPSAFLRASAPLRFPILSPFAISRPTM